MAKKRLTLFDKGAVATFIIIALVGFILFREGILSFNL
ncbi:hypothetical protein HNP93_000899 [Methanococcus maripaludis]|uniref:Uncharacterized protein n=1 Tax=Methanococcus maripaludis TaxID=39152 RepID=A0A7J9P643_METMI|nr:hypothetical protein [Methanococcus maripaludis]